MKKRSLNRFTSAITSFALVFSLYHCFPNTIINIKKNSVSHSAAAEKTENPFDYQDDMEVPYDTKSWVQPREWNSPTIDTKNYNSGIMIYFDKISYDAEYAKGDVKTVYCSITGAKEPVSRIKFHIFYDTRLTVKENSNGEVVTAGKGLNGFTTGSTMVEEGQLVFYATSEDTMLNKSCLFTIDFIVPETAEQGEVYPIGISYVDDGIAYDSFINSEQDDAGKLQMAYVFTKGIHNGYIKINGEKKTTTTAAAVTTTMTTAVLSPDDYPLGDINNDGNINAVDASAVLTYYAYSSTNNESSLNEAQKKAADINKNGQINAVDASYILSYYAYTSTSKEAIMPIEEYIKKK